MPEGRIRQECVEEFMLHPGGADGRKTRVLNIPEDLFPAGGYGPGKTRDYAIVGIDELSWMFDHYREEWVWSEGIIEGKRTRPLQCFAGQDRQARSHIKLPGTVTRLAVPVGSDYRHHG